MKTYLKTDLAYAAGFIDGEGCFYVGFRRGVRGRRCFPCTVTVAQTERDSLQRLQGLFGGKVYEAKTTGFSKRPVWTWSIYGTDADTMVRLIMPYLRGKRAQAIVYMQMRQLINANPMGKRITDTDLEVRLGLVKQISSLKRAA